MLKSMMVLSPSILKKAIDRGGVPMGGKMTGFNGKLNDDEKLALISNFHSCWADQIYQSWILRGGLK